jgi:microcystin-dependent protein
MAYTITKSDGTVLTTIADGTRDTTTSLSLAGPNYVGYGQQLDQNLVYLLENFASNGAPSSINLQGQLWFDKFNQVLKVFTAQGYVAVSGVTNSSSEPSQGKNGDIWFNTSTEQMYVYDNSGTGGFKIVGPAYTKQQGISGAVPATVEDGSISGIYHNILKLQFGNVTYATVSTDGAFIPTPALPGFTFINPGITFSSNVLGPTINANVTGIVTGNVTGTLFGNVVASILSGNLTGNVVGNVTGNVVATTLSGNLTGNVTAESVVATNFSSSNIAVTGGTVTGLANVSATTATITNLAVTNTTSTNLTSSNIIVTGGTVTGLTNFSTTLGQSTNFSSSNIHVTGGSATGLTAFRGATGQATNFSSANILVTGGSATGLTAFSATTGQATNFGSANILVTGGSATGLTAFSATTGQATNFGSANILVTGGSVSNITGSGVTLSDSDIQTSTATTKTANDKTTAIATTAFVHSVLPTGIIVMWNNTAASIPAGWQLCNGSNGTPDLRGQFIIGAGGSYDPATTGGAATVTLASSQMPVHTHVQAGTLTTGTAGSHTHTATVTDPGHRHTLPLVQQVGTFGSQLHGAWNGGSTATTTSTTGISVGINTVTDHTHSLTLSGNTASAGGTSGTTQPHENLPPYYALCYIQKMY